MMNGKRRVLAFAVLPCAVFLLSCGPKVDLKQALQVRDVSSGWADAGVVSGQNKLVPSITFRLQKTPETTLTSVAMNVVFKRLNGQAEEDSDEVFLQKVEFASANQTNPLTVRAEHGYTADPPQSRADMLKNSRFQDFRAVVFAKHSAANWVELGRFDIQRQLLLK